MSSSVNLDLVREIAERIDDGRRVNLRNLSQEFNVDYGDVSDAYDELARQRGCDPLLDRINRRCERLRQMAHR